MNKRKKFLAIFLTCLLIVTFVGCENTVVQDENNASDYDFSLSSEINSTDFVTLSMTDITPLSSGNLISKKIVATVLPETATNREVDWTCEWVDSNNTTNVSNYITVVPDFNGSNLATITCHAAFEGNVIITVTTRESGYSAFCIVSFIGIPTELSINGSVQPIGNVYKLGIGEAYQFDVVITNPYGQIGKEFNNFTCGISGVGSLTLAYKEVYTSGTEKWFIDRSNTVSLDSLKNNFISSNYSNGKLTITTIKSIESYYESTQRLDSGRTRGYTNMFYSFIDDCYFKVWIKENTSGIIKEYIVRFDESIVTNISIDLTEIFF